MQREPWPPLPPGGHRAPDTPPFGGFAEQALLYGLLGTGTAGLLAWTTGQLAALAFGHTWLDLGINDVAAILWTLPHHWNDPALAWPARVHGALPGPVGMYASTATVVGGAAGGRRGWPWGGAAAPWVWANGQRRAAAGRRSRPAGPRRWGPGPRAASCG